MTSDSILSQDAIDALLAGSGFGTDAAPASEPSTAPASVAPTGDIAPEVVTSSPAPSQSSGSDSEVTLEQVITIAGQAAEAEAAPVHDSISRIYQRIGNMEQMVARIAQLEAEVDRLKRAA